VVDQMSAQHVPPDQAEGDRREGEVGAVDRGCDMRVDRFVPQVLGEQVRRERQQRGPQQQQQVEEHQSAVGPLDLAEHRVVVDPHDAEDGEAGQIGGELRPLLDQRRPEVLAGLELRDVQFEDEQGDRDREDAVAEGLNARGLGEVRLGAHGHPV